VENQLLHNMILHCRQRRTKAEPEEARTENLVKFGYTRRLNMRQTYTHAHHNTLHPLPGIACKNFSVSKLYISATILHLALNARRCQNGNVE